MQWSLCTMVIFLQNTHRRHSLVCLWGQIWSVLCQSLSHLHPSICCYHAILCSMASQERVIVGLSQSAPAVGWGSLLHASLASVNWIGSARYLNRGYPYGARGMHYHILLRPCSQNYYTYSNVVKNTYSPQRCTCPNFNWEYRMVTALQRRKLNMF